MTHRILYNLELTPEQLNYLSVDKYGKNRMQFFVNLLRNAALYPYTSTVAGYNETIQIGQVEKSLVQLSEEWSCDRKIVAKVLDEMQQLGMVSTQKDHLTSVHSIHVVSCWIADGVRIWNPQHIKLADYRSLTNGNLTMVNGMDAFLKTMRESQEQARANIRRGKAGARKGKTILIPTTNCIECFFFDQHTSSTTPIDNQSQSETTFPYSPSSSSNEVNASAANTLDGDAAEPTVGDKSAEIATSPNTALSEGETAEVTPQLPFLPQ